MNREKLASLVGSCVVAAALVAAGIGAPYLFILWWGRQGFVLYVALALFFGAWILLYDRWHRRW